MTAARVRYEERQRLLAADLSAEQTYRLALAGRHMLAPHQWGIVSGLRVVQSNAESFLEPGLAIDGDGREIVVPEAVRLMPPDAPCVSVVLFYCEFPEQLEPPRCPDAPAPRIGHRYRLMLDPDFVAPVIEPDVQRALAAGPKTGARPWPVLLGQIGSACFKAGEEPPDVPVPIRFADTKYVTHRAGGIRTPTDRALMQLGPSGHEDIYHFLISTRNAQGGFDRRIGIDRDGDIRVWKNLTIIGGTGIGEVNLGAQLSMRIQVPMPSTPSPRVVLSARLDPATGILTASRADSGAAATFVTAMKLDRSVHLATDVMFADRRAARIELLEARKPVLPFIRPPGQKSGPRSQPRFETFSVEAKPIGGALIMKRPLEAVEEVEPPQCGDLERTRALRGGAGPPVVRFTAGKDLKANPQMREMFQLDRSDLVPRTEFRISGGAIDENDPHPRFSIGDGRDGGWSPALTMSGSGKLVLGRPYTGIPPAALAVTGTVYLPPIGKDDPILPALMAQALIAGLLLMGKISTDVTVAFTPPAKIVSGQGFEYDLTVTRSIVNQTVKIKKCLEIIRVVEGGSNVVISQVPGLPSELTNANPVTVPVRHPAFAISGKKVRIAIQLQIAVGTVNAVVEKESAPVEVEQQIN